MQLVVKIIYSNAELDYHSTNRLIIIYPFEFHIHSYKDT